MDKDIHEVFRHGVSKSNITPGLYFGTTTPLDELSRSECFQLELVIKVEGVPPFLRAVVFNIDTHEVTENSVLENVTFITRL